MKQGDEVITQAFNFIATIEAILDTGAKPVIVGVDILICVQMTKKDYEKTKVIIPVQMLGVPADLKNIIKISKAKKSK